MDRKIKVFGKYYDVSEQFYALGEFLTHKTLTENRELHNISHETFKALGDYLTDFFEIVGGDYQKGVEIIASEYMKANAQNPGKYPLPMDKSSFGNYVMHGMVNDMIESYQVDIYMKNALPPITRYCPN